MSAWIAVVAAGAACFALRFVPAALAARRELPSRARRALDHVGPAAFAALAAPALVSADPHSGPFGARLVAVAVALPVAHRTRSAVATLATGLPVLWVLTAVTAH